MYHQDWLMRQIESITRYAFSLLLGKADELSSDIHLETNRQTDGDAGSLSFLLAGLVREERLCEAENLLYAAVEQKDPEALTVGLRFYESLNRLSDEMLKRCNFPRDEIYSGLRELCSLYGYDLSVLGE
ncbi:MAG: hypothetical protein J5789_08095 [Oscillospiraceae bacterium]|nr:hypothetical protein [Oscillospiraceae bacterium]